MKGFFTTIIVLLFASIFAQIPVFVDQYQMRLEGHLAESEQHLRTYEEVARLRHKTLEQYVDRFLAHSDADFQAEGRLIQKTIVRTNGLTRAHEALVSSHLIVRPIIFFRYVDFEILTETWQGFIPGLLITAQLAIWATIGTCAALLSIWEIRSLWADLWPKKR